MHLIGRTLLSLAVAALVACSSAEMAGPPVGFNHASAVAACGPADGPAVQIFFTATEVVSGLPTTPYVSIFVAEQPAALVGRTLSLAGANAEGSAQFFANAAEFESAESGSLTVNSVGADNSIQGRVDITFPNAAPVRGTFSAKWIPNQVFCS
jgi:hypothetical protein